MKRSRIRQEYYFLDYTQYLINDYFGPMFMLVPIQSELAELFVTKINRDGENDYYI